MNINYIKSVIKDLDEVLESKKSKLSKSDFKKLSQAKTNLQESLINNLNTEISIEDKINYTQIIILIMEIIKGVSDNYK